MPPVFAAITAAGAAVGTATAAAGSAIGALSFTGLVTATGSVTLLGKIVLTGALIFLSRLFPGPEQPKPSETKQEVKQAIPPRMFHYGRVRVAGPLAFYETANYHNEAFNNNRALYKIVLLSSRMIDGIEKHFLDDNEVAVGGDGFVSGVAGGPDYSTGGGSPRVQGSFYLGTDDQLADPMLLDAFNFNEWTEEHRLRGIAYAVWCFIATSAAKFPIVYPSGEPQYTALIRGSLLYDPRLDSTVSGGSGTHRHNDPSTWQWSDNSALCILDFLTYADGYAQPIAEMDLASFQAMANVCDQLFGTNLPAPDNQEKRYRTSTTVYLNEPRKDVLRRLLTACDGQLYQRADGRMGIRGGRWVAPTAEISAAVGELLDAEFTEGVDPLQRYNEIAFQFMSPAHKWIEVEGDPWQDEEAIAATGVIVTQTVDLSMVPSHTQARRLCKIQLSRDNPRWIGTARTSFKGLDMIGESVVTLSWNELDEPAGNFDGPFWITQLTMPADGTGLAVSLQSADSAAYTWNPATDAGTPPAVPEDDDVAVTLPAVTGTPEVGGDVTGAT